MGRKSGNGFNWYPVAMIILCFTAVSLVLNIIPGLPSGAFGLIASVLTVVMVAIFSYRWARQSKGWFIVWLIALIVILVCYVLGFGVLFGGWWTV